MIKKDETAVYQIYKYVILYIIELSLYNACIKTKLGDENL